MSSVYTVRPHEKRVAAPRRNRVIAPNAHAWNILVLLTTDEVAVRSEQAIVPFLHLRSSYALDPQSMEETSE